MTDMEMYENVDDVLESKEKPDPSSNELYETLQRTHQKEDTKKVLTCVFNTPTCQFLCLLLLVMASSSLSIAALVLTTTEKSIDGSWSSWTNWEVCSTTCDAGMQKRGRNCSNPAPRGTGRQCLGTDMEFRLCQSEPCRLYQTTTKDPSENVKAIDGSWSSWANWEACSTTCDVGMQKRGRNCSDPAPRGTGRQCLGMDMEVRLCQSEPCRMDQTTTKGPSENVVDTYIAFNAFNADLNSGRNNVVFTSVLLNEGGAYNRSNGIFTATFPGLYLFIGHVCVKTLNKDADYALKVEGKSVASGEFRTPSNAAAGVCTSFSAVAAVQKEEKVWVECNYLYQNNNDWNSFSGILIHKT